MESSKVSSILIANNAYKLSQAQAQVRGQEADAHTQVSARNEIPKKDSVQVNSAVASKNLDTVRVIEQMHASLNLLAKGVRETNESVSKAVELVNSINNDVQEIVRNPVQYPVDSKERNEKLMQYTSLRKELISLMVPPPPPPLYEKVTHMWDSLFEQKSGTLQQDLVPGVEASDSDAQLRKVSITLDKTSEQLADFSNKVTHALVRP